LTYWTRFDNEDKKAKIEMNFITQMKSDDDEATDDLILK